MRRIIILLVVLLIGVGYTMAQESSEMAQKPPQEKEKILSKGMRTRNGYNSLQSAYKAALREARQEYPDKNIGIRNLEQGDIKIDSDGRVLHHYNYSVVELPNLVVQKLVEATNTATRSISEGNCFAVDSISIIDGKTEMNIIKNQLIGLLIIKGYKVLAKEKLAKLYDEQYSQQSGIYNSETTVETNNFTASGYFISVSITRTYVQVQVVNVSTGEYEGNVTVNL